VHFIAHGDLTTGGDIAKAIACGADAVMLGEPLAAGAEMPGCGMYWAHTVSHPNSHQNLPRSALEQFLLASERVMLSEVLIGPTFDPTGTATCSARCAARWPGAATPPSRSSSA